LVNRIAKGVRCHDLQTELNGDATGHIGGTGGGRRSCGRRSGGGKGESRKKVIGKAEGGRAIKGDKKKKKHWRRSRRKSRDFGNGTKSKESTKNHRPETLKRTMNQRELADLNSRKKKKKGKICSINTLKPGETKAGETFNGKNRHPVNQYYPVSKKRGEKSRRLKGGHRTKECPEKEEAQGMGEGTRAAGGEPKIRKRLEVKELGKD